MGNACFCNNLENNFKGIKINICVDKQSFNEVTEHILNKEEIIMERHEKGINELKKYFDENEQEIINEINQKEKMKRLFHKKKKPCFKQTSIDNKYEFMLKRLLDQKNIKRTGPKRRETIRKEGQIKVLIDEAIEDNKNKKEVKDNNEETILNRGSTLIIKNKKSSKVRFSITINKEELVNNLKNKVNKKLIKNVITLNEIVNEGNASSGFGKKETNKK